MNKANFDETIAHYTKERKKGIGFSTIRKELTNQKVEDQKIKDIISLLSRREIAEEKRKMENSMNINFALMGLFLFALGLGVTIYSYINGKSQYVLWYGAILIGIGMLTSGLIKYRKRIDK